MGTWDVAAVHPISTSELGSYADPQIMDWIRQLSSRISRVSRRHARKMLHG